MDPIVRWTVEQNGVYWDRRGNISLMIEKVGANFRVLVTRVIHEMQPEEVIYAGSAVNAADAMTMAERVAERACAQMAA
jgi:hypothetical protein